MLTFCKHDSLLHQGEKQSDIELPLWNILFMYVIKGEGERRQERGQII